MAMSWRTASYFSSRPTTATDSSRSQTTIRRTRTNQDASPRTKVALPRHEQADAQAQTDGEFPRKIAIFLAAVRKLKELIRGAVALNAVKKLSAAARPVLRPQTALP